MTDLENPVIPYNNYSYEELIKIRDKISEDVSNMESAGINHQQTNAYLDKLRIMSKIYSLIAEKYAVADREHDMGHWLFILRDYLIEQGKSYDSDLTDEVKKRNNGKNYTLSDHIRGMVYSMLTNQTKWHNIHPHLQEIDKLFFDYNPDRIISTEPDYFVHGLRQLKCGNRNIAAQMNSLSGNINVFRIIERDYGSVDKFLSSDNANNIVSKLSEPASEYKLRMLGPALVWEYVRNVGVDGAKPDTHLRRFLGADRMGTGEIAQASVDEVIHQVEQLSQMTGLTKTEIDAIIWRFCATGYGEVCTENPRCSLCPISSYCKHGKRQNNI